MALVLKDRVKETTSTSGTGSITLLGPVQGYQGFSSVGDGNTTYYCISGVAEWEVGIGTYSAGVLSRDTVLGSSDNGNKVAFSSGIKDVFCTFPASKTVISDDYPMNGATSTSSPNDTVNVASITPEVASTNGDIAIVPKGSGAILGQVPTATSAGGNKRGSYAVDLQLRRTSASHVASGLYSGVLSGYRNRASAESTVVAGGEANWSSDIFAAVGGGNTNIASAAYATVAGGQNNGASGQHAGALSGYLNTASGTQSVVSGGRNNIANTLLTTISGGRDSIASGSYATIGGGFTNAASGQYTAIAGGSNNTASSNYSSIGGGQTNSVTGTHAVVAGGQSNTASAASAAVGGGGSNTASGLYSYVGGGFTNVASNTYSVVAGGNTSTASGLLSSILGGSNNLASGRSSSVVGGEYGTTRGIVGYLVTPASSVPIEAKLGVQQAGCLVLGCQTTDATATKLRSDSNAAGATNQLILQNNSAVYVFGYIVANVTGGGDTRSWIIAVTIKRGANAAATTIVGSSIAPQHNDAGASTWDVAVAADTTNGGLAVTVTGQASTTIRWVCNLETTEVAF